MAEIATNVLHNVGNVLNSVNISSQRVKELTNEMRVSSLNNLATLLTQQRENLPGFFSNDEKAKLLTVLINLISNACNAIIAGNTGKREILIKLSTENTMARVDICDSGIGITPDNLKKIFQFGFTTRKDGHGFGLNSAIMTMREMEGNITAQSNGPGTGATFTVLIPIKENSSTLNAS